MALTHAGLAIPGTHHAITPANPDRMEEFLTQWGNPGAVHFPGGITTGTVNVPMTIHDNYNLAQLQAKLNAITDHDGTQGTLTETTGLLRSWTNVLFEGLEYGELGGRADILYTSNLGYILKCVLRFRFLRPFSGG